MKRDLEPDTRVFFSLAQIADTARRELWPTGDRARVYAPKAQEVSGYGEGVCIDCGTVSARLLHPGFPHICSRCLFPPAQPDPRELAQALLTSVQRRQHARKATALDTA